MACGRGYREAGASAFVGAAEVGLMARGRWPRCLLLFDLCCQQIGLYLDWPKRKDADPGFVLFGDCVSEILSRLDGNLVQMYVKRGP